MINRLLQIILLCALVACSKGKVEMQSNITSMEKKLSDSKEMVPDSASAVLMIKEYVAFAEKYPDDTLSPGYLFKAAGISEKIRDINKACSLLKQVAEKYPQNKLAPNALFYQAFIWENIAGDLESARKCYTSFLEKYPDHEMAKDARISLENLGKSPEELLKSISPQRSDSVAQTSQAHS